MEIISFSISNSDIKCSLAVECWLDNQLITDSVVNQTININIPVPMDTAEHELKIILKNKLPEHTVIDPQGAIVQDAVLIVDDFYIDTYNINQLVSEHAEYTHDYNGSQESATHTFHGTMGCNGTLALKFASPIYQWILANT